jgi:hypothetical protein
MSKVIESIEHDAFSLVMNPPEDGFDGQADIRTNAQGQKWAYCPWCNKKHFPLNQKAKIKDFNYQCRNSKCKRIFIVNTEG